VGGGRGGGRPGSAGDWPVVGGRELQFCTLKYGSTCTLPNPSLLIATDTLATYNILRHTLIQSIDRTQPCLGKKKEASALPSQLELDRGGDLSLSTE
jgi:hypothetical protein